MMRRGREHFRFSHSKMMISIAKSIENHAQKPKFSPAALIQNQTQISECNKTRGGFYKGGILIQDSSDGEYSE